MPNTGLVELFHTFAARHPEQRPLVARYLTLLETHPDCLLRTCYPGHLTASAWVVTADRQGFLLTHHRKLNRWLQLGGHADGDAELARVALREAHEESGLQSLTLWRPEPLDLDVHWIPPRPDEPAHWHYDVRFLLVVAAAPDLPAPDLVVSSESHDLRWFRWAELGSVAGDDSVARLGRKALAWLGEAR